MQGARIENDPEGVTGNSGSVGAEEVQRQHISFLLLFLKACPQPYHLGAIRSDRRQALESGRDVGIDGRPAMVRVRSESGTSRWAEDLSCS